MVEPLGTEGGRQVATNSFFPLVEVVLDIGSRCQPHPNLSPVSTCVCMGICILYLAFIFAT